MKTTLKKISLTLSIILLCTFMALAEENSIMVPPSNDLIANAIDIDMGPFPYSELGVNFPEATNTNDTPGGACDVAAAAIWYKFTAESSGLVSAVMVNAQSSIVIFFSAPDENITLATQLTYVSQGSNPCESGSSSTIQTTAGTTYYILMKNNIVSDVLININAAMVPSNDLIENAINLVDGPYPYEKDLVRFNHATLNHDPTGGDCSVSAAGVWYKFTARTSGMVHATIASNPAVPYVIFFSAPNEEVMDGLELTYEDQPFNDCSQGETSSIIATAGITYYIYMKNALAASIEININEALAPENDYVTYATNLNGLQEYNDEAVIFAAATSTADGGESGCDLSPAKAVWYKFTAPIDGQVVAGISVTQGTGGVIFYTAEDENAVEGSQLTWVDQSSNPCAANNLSSIQATAGITYYLFAALADGFQVADVAVNLAGILGVSDNSLEGFTYYPNPVTNQLNIQSKNNIDEISIFNLVGQKVLGQSIRATSKSLDISHLNAGMYIMKVRANGTTATYKILKQ